jgi:general stress protein 26
MATKDETATSKLWGMIKEIRIAMLTSDDGGLLRSRPMGISQRSFDGTLWFFTRADSHKVDEVQQDERVGVSFADPAQQTYVSMSGHARLIRDLDVIKEHWREGVRIWFPRGTHDPDIALLRVDVETAEYWDAPASAMVFVAGYAKAFLTGRPPHPGENDKLQLS